jgi:hypothetical protein
VASFVLPHESANSSQTSETISGSIGLEAAAESGSQSQSSPCPSLSSVCTNFNSDSASNTTTESVVTAAKDTTSVAVNASDVLAVENTSCDEYGASSSVSRRRKYESFCGNNHDESSTVSKSDSGLLNQCNPLEVGDTLDTAQHNYSYGLRVCPSYSGTRTCTCTNGRDGCGETCKLSGHCPSFPSVLSTDANVDVDGAVQYAQYRSDRIDSSKLFELRKDQRVLIELAELGLIHSFDNKISVDAMECIIDDSDNGMGVSGMDFINVEVEVEVEVDSGNACMSSNSRNTVKREGWSSVTERFQSNRADDEICSGIRCMVRAPANTSNLFYICILYVFSANMLFFTNLFSLQI